MKKKTADIVAEGFIARHADYLVSNGGWSIEQIDNARSLSDYGTKRVLLGSTAISCQVADSEELQTIGLQKHAGLNDGEGMAFPYDPPRRVSFHMAKVNFPIDIAFVNSSGRISKIVEDISPGTPGSWGMPHTSMVVEVPGGFCRSANISVGDEAGFDESFDLEAFVKRSMAQTAAPALYDASKLDPAQLAKLKAQVDRARQIYQSGKLNQLPPDHKIKVIWLLEMGAQPSLSGALKGAPAIGQMPTVASREAQERFNPEITRRDINPLMQAPNPTHDRFKDRDSPDVVTEDQPMDGDHYDQTQGYDPTKDLSDEVAPTRPSF
jgi:uncharacterized membrane protein (UPF0127 family)